MSRITWFNPPYSKNVVTRIGQKFLRLMTGIFLWAPNSTKYLIGAQSRSATAASLIWSLLLSPTAPVYVWQDVRAMTNLGAATVESLTVAPSKGSA